MIQAALDAANPSDHVIIGRLVLTSATGAIQLWQHDREQWTREEGLSEIAVAEFIELPEGKSITTHAKEDESFVERVARQIGDAKVPKPSSINFTLNDSNNMCAGFPSLCLKFCEAFCHWIL